MISLQAKQIIYSTQSEEKFLPSSSNCLPKLSPSNWPLESEADAHLPPPHAHGTPEPLSRHTTDARHRI
uniref:Uncharacterized protein n=1 Tax=Arundo donax TaxID=35708 RepID=A0A0A9F858_ARUDO